MLVALEVRPLSKTSLSFWSNLYGVKFLCLGSSSLFHWSCYSYWTLSFLEVLLGLYRGWAAFEFANLVRSTSKRRAHENEDKSSASAASLPETGASPRACMRQFSITTDWRSRNVLKYLLRMLPTSFRKYKMSLTVKYYLKLWSRKVNRYQARSRPVKKFCSSSSQLSMLDS